MEIYLTSSNIPQTIENQGVKRCNSVGLVYLEKESGEILKFDIYPILKQYMNHVHVDSQWVE